MYHIGVNEHVRVRVQCVGSKSKFWRGCVPLLENWGGGRPPCPPVLTPLTNQRRITSSIGPKPTRSTSREAAQETSPSSWCPWAWGHRSHDQKGGPYQRLRIVNRSLYAKAPPRYSIASIDRTTLYDHKFSSCACKYAQNGLQQRDRDACVWSHNWSILARVQL